MMNLNLLWLSERKFSTFQRKSSGSLTEKSFICFSVLKAIFYYGWDPLDKQSDNAFYFKVLEQLHY